MEDFGERAPLPLNPDAVVEVIENIGRQFDSDTAQRVPVMDAPTEEPQPLVIEESMAYGKVPRYKVVSAYVQLAMDKGEFTQQDVVKYMRQRRLGKAAAREALVRHTGGNHEKHQKYAQTRAAEITAYKPTPKFRPEKPKTMSPSVKAPRSKIVKPSNFSGSTSLGSFIDPELQTDMQRQFISALDLSALTGAVIPLDDTPYGDVQYPRWPKNSHHHYLNLLGKDTIRSCSMANEQALDEEERLILNLLLIFGKYGLRAAALDETGITNRGQAIYHFRDKVNGDNHAVVAKLRSQHACALVSDPHALTIKDKRT